MGLLLTIIVGVVIGGLILRNFSEILEFIIAVLTSKTFWIIIASLIGLFVLCVVVVVNK